MTGTIEIRQATDEIESVFYPYLPGQVEESFSEEFDSFTPRFTLTYLANNDLTFYGNVAKGTKPGGFNDSGSPKIAYDEEEAWNYEVGAKVTILDGRGTWNSSLYMIDWTDQQLTFNAQRPDGSDVIYRQRGRDLGHWFRDRAQHDAHRQLGPDRELLVHQCGD